MISLANLYRIKISIWLRQMYMPGVRGAIWIILVNVIVVLTIRLVAKRMARLATEQTDLIVKPAKRSLAYVTVHK